MTSSATGGHVVIDTRGSRRIGAGHVVRSLELARRLRGKGRHVVFLPPGASMTALVRQRSFAIQSPSSMREGPALVLIDRPDAAPALFARHSRRWPNARIVVLDYYGDIDGAVAAVINLNAGREDFRVRGRRGTLYRCGPAFATLRESFRRIRDIQPHARATPRRIGICFGGTDPSNWTGLAVEALAPILRRGSLRAEIFLGRPSRVVTRAAEVLGAELVQVYVALGDPSVRLSKCDILVTGGGTLMMEAACLGVPAIVMPRNREERLFAQTFQSAGAVRVMKQSARFPSTLLATTTSMLVGNAGKRRAMSIAGRRLIDGKGAGRVVALMVSLIGAKA